MIFGRFQGDKKLDIQRADFAESLALLVELEGRLSGSHDLYDEFATVWGDGIPEDLSRKVAKARELADLLGQRLAMAKRELSNFDDAAALLKRELPGLDQDWKVFVATLLARKTIAEARGSAYPQPGTEECQRALLGTAQALHRDLGVHIDELFDVRARFQGPWPALLNLERMQRGLIDAQNALEIYAGRLDAGQGALPETSTVSLFDMIAMLRNSLSIIEELRVQLAAHTVMRAAMRNTGLA